MWMDKLCVGVVRVLTPIGPRYIQPTSFRQRLYLMWTFRHFHTLPQQVLRSWQRRLIERLCAEHRFISLPDTMDDAPLIGTVDRRPPVSAESMPPRRPNTRVADAAMAPLVADAQPRS
jgi:hypothetical protein